MDFTHFDPGGKAWMVDVSGKEDTRREAVAEGMIRMSRECFERVAQGSIEKGDVLGTARIAGIMGAKKTAELIPLCHLLNLVKLSVDFDLLPEEHAVRAVCTAGTVGKTGAEMEAMTGVVGARPAASFLRMMPEQGWRRASSFSPSVPQSRGYRHSSSCQA